MNKVFVAIDDSDDFLKLMRFGQQFAAHMGAELGAVSVVAKKMNVMSDESGCIGVLQRRA